MTAPDEVPSWLVPGAQVVVYSTGGAGPRNTVLAKVDRVAKLSFTVVGEYGRFNIQRLSRQGGTWSSTRHVVGIDSPEGKAEIAAARSRRKVSDAQYACDKWSRSHNADDARAAIVALEAMLDDGVAQ